MKLREKVALGSAQFGFNYGISNQSGKPDLSTVRKILEYAQTVPIRVVDTAGAYGDAEEVLGTLGVSSFQVVSKFMPPSEFGAIGEQLKNSLSKLRISSLYGYMAHRPVSVLANDENWKALCALRDSGAVSKIGFSLNSLEEYALLREKGIVPDLIQVPFNLFDNRFVDAMKELKSKGCEIHTRSAFLQGLFFLPEAEFGDYFLPFREDIISLRNKTGQNLSSALLKYVLHHDFVDSVVLGVQNWEQLEESILGLDEAPALDELDKRFPENLLMPSNWPKKQA